MKNSSLLLFAAILFLFNPPPEAQVPVKAAHVIIVMEENYAYSEIIGSALTPALTVLSKISYTANFIQEQAIQHYVY